MDAGLIIRSLELAGEACADPAPMVYARLFAEHPDMEALFVRDTDGSVRGEMLSRVFEAILDFIDRRAYGAQMIQCEVVTHEGYGVPPEVFGVFFRTVAATLRAIVGPAWSPDIDASWSVLLDQLDWYATHPEQAVGVAAKP